MVTENLECPNCGNDDTLSAIMNAIFTLKEDPEKIPYTHDCLKCVCLNCACVWLDALK